MTQEARRAEGWWSNASAWFVGSHRLPSRAQRHSIDVVLEMCLELKVVEFSESKMCDGSSGVRLQAYDVHDSMIADFWVDVDGGLEMVDDEL